jgi:oxaloacetate decarboxylase alpha subunit
VRLAHEPIDDILTYAMFPQIGWRFLQHRHDPSAFEPAPVAKPAETSPIAAGKVAARDETRIYAVKVNGNDYQVEVGPGGSVRSVEPRAAVTAVNSGGETVRAPMAGLVLRIAVREVQHVAPGDVVVVMEAMKMETEVRARAGGRATLISVKAGDSVGANDELVSLA